MNIMLVKPNHTEQLHLMKLYYSLDELELYQLKIMKVITRYGDKGADKVFFDHFQSLFLISVPIYKGYEFVFF